VSEARQPLHPTLSLSSLLAISLSSRYSFAQNLWISVVSRAIARSVTRRRTLSLSLADHWEGA